MKDYLGALREAARRGDDDRGGEVLAEMIAGNVDPKLITAMLTQAVAEAHQPAVKGILRFARSLDDARDRARWEREAARVASDCSSDAPAPVHRPLALMCYKPEPRARGRSR